MEAAKHEIYEFYISPLHWILKKIPGSYKLVAQLVIWIEMLSKISEKYINVQDPNLHDGNEHQPTAAASFS